MEEEGVAAPKTDVRASCYNFPDEDTDVLQYNMQPEPKRSSNELMMNPECIEHYAKS